jgi:hypothetical protein
MHTSVGPTASIAFLENLPFSKHPADAIVQHVRPLSGASVGSGLVMGKVR